MTLEQLNTHYDKILNGIQESLTSKRKEDDVLRHEVTELQKGFGTLAAKLDSIDKHLSSLTRRQEQPTNWIGIAMLIIGLLSFGAAYIQTRLSPTEAFVTRIAHEKPEEYERAGARETALQYQSSWLERLERAQTQLENKQDMLKSKFDSVTASNSATLELLIRQVEKIDAQGTRSEGTILRGEIRQPKRKRNPEAG